MAPLLGGAFFLGMMRDAARLYKAPLNPNPKTKTLSSSTLQLPPHPRRESCLARASAQKSSARSLASLAFGDPLDPIRSSV